MISNTYKKVHAFFLSILLACSALVYCAFPTQAKAAAPNGGTVVIDYIKCQHVREKYPKRFPRAGYGYNPTDGHWHSMMDVHIAAIDGHPCNIWTVAICDNYTFACPICSKGPFEASIQSDGSILIPGENRIWGDVNDPNNWGEDEFYSPGIKHQWQSFTTAVNHSPNPAIITSGGETYSKTLLTNANSTYDGTLVNNQYTTAAGAWSNPGTQTATYHGKSDPDKFSYNNTVSASNLIDIATRTWLAVNGNIVWENTTYSWGSNSTTSHSINYKANQPAITQEKYRPWNLNYNALAQKTDTIGQVDNSFYTDEPIQAAVNNKHNVSNGNLLESLNLNNDYMFQLKFNTSTFGLPERYNWYNDPPSLANNTWELSDKNKPYANGYTDPTGTGYRYNTTFRAAMNNQTQSASLTVGDGEYTYESPFIKTNKNVSWNGGDFSTRFILTGQYTTGNGKERSKYPDWFIVEYSQGKFFEYGTNYEGLITSTYIEKPRLSGCEASTTWGGIFAWGTGENLSYDTDGSTNRGVYVGYTSQHMEQPILYGKWEVKTIAGDIG